jgi:hypothetical protein
MAFSISNTTIDNYKLIQSLVVPSFAGPTAPLVYDAQNATGYISADELSASKIIKITNSEGSVIVFPGNEDLVRLYTNPTSGSLVDWTLVVDSNADTFSVVCDDDSVNLSGSTCYNLLLEMATGPADFSGTGVGFNMHYSIFNSSIIMPVPLVQTINTSATGTLSWTYLNAGAGYPPSLMIQGAAGATGALTLDSGLNLWNKLFGSASMPTAGALYYGDIAIINNNSSPFTVDSTLSPSPSGNAVTLLGSPPIALPSKAVMLLKIKFTAKSATLATAEASSTVISYTA